MTATASITAAQRHDVLLVPNSALRFAPDTGAADSPASGGGIISNLMPRMPRTSTRKSAAATANTATVRQVWILRDGAVAPISVIPGISDGHLTEITGGDLQAGMEVIIDQKAPVAR